MEAPEVRYVARPDGVSIAYAVAGEGPVDLVYVPGFISHLDLAWADPHFAGFLKRISSFSRLVMFDKPGTGLSDPVPAVPTLEERARDIEIVMDAAGLDRAAVLGFSEGGLAALVLAASRPERVSALVLYGCIPKGRPSEEELISAGVSPALYRERAAAAVGLTESWGKGRSLELFAPSVAGDPALRRFWALYERAAASPAMARMLIDAVWEMDVTGVLPAISTPTLVLHHRDEFIPLANGRILADGIAGARLVELEGRDHVFWMSDMNPAMDEIERFLTGAIGTTEPERALATVLFCDVVGSTETAAARGDAGWRDELERHERTVDEAVTRFGGRLVKSMGDGHLAEFDGPARAVRCALWLRDHAALVLRTGIHTGECERMGDDLGGIAVHIGSRVSAMAGPGEVLVSGTVRDLVVGSRLEFGARGEHTLKGVPGRWRIYSAEPRDDPAVAPAQERELRAGDRIALRAVRHAPKLTRAAARLTQRRAARRSRD